MTGPLISYDIYAKADPLCRNQEQTQNILMGTSDH